MPRDQVCCGALQAHNGRLDTARRLARATPRRSRAWITSIVNAAGCGAHMRDYGDLADDLALPVRDLMAFLDEEGLDARRRKDGGVR